ncbi:tyrosine-type recombinase/integrase [Novosphingobium sp. KACC 22771]|uniref:tyrosine-type recombinase/integrase n=1 Tax=Novosphingobium sp. KACC 22771 TaxID=3025670 RepID=UPI0023667AB3|nr:site-specific integrase [Novosphingobium sp. KACC 22771]WDF73940.1 integrase arm-type DNA-binding domain-containing protein [Novosphingobium sp. KACC 22771]
MAKAPITKRTVDAAKPAEAEYVVWDDGGKETIKGFGLKVTPAGGKIYIFQYRLARVGQADKTAPRKYTIGKHGELTPDQARSRAKELAMMVAQGIDPRQRELDLVAAQDEAKHAAEQKARLEGELAFEKVAERWLEHYEDEKGRRPRTVDQAKHVVNAHLLPALKGKPLPHITRTDLQLIIDGIPVKHRASRLAVYAYASVLFRWAMERGEIIDNPVRLMAKPSAPEARDRVLTDDELVAIWKAASSLRDPFGPYFQLLMLTGQRREEVASMNWAELDRSSSMWVIPANKAKNGVAHMVPLAPRIIVELDRLALIEQNKAKADEPAAERWPKAGSVISLRGKQPLTCYSRAKRQLDEATEAGTVSPWRVHDLRRTLATGLQRLGVRFEVTEAVLNHVSGARSGVAGIYQRHDWKDEKRSAMEAWGRHLTAILNPIHETNVVSISEAKQSA